MLEITNLKKEYKDFTLDCTMRVKKGYITGLIGPNGSGKSTAFKAILGLIKFNEGTVTVMGKDIKSFTEKDKEKIGVVLSDSGFSAYLTVKDIIPILKNLYSEFDCEFFTSQLEHFSLPLNKQLKDFSTGMKAKLKLLVALSHKAQLLILDEPTVGLDVVVRDELILMIREYMEKNEHSSVLISSHISSDLETLCDDLYMIYGGKIILHEQTDVILNEYALLKCDESQYAGLDKKYILYTKKEPYGFSCLTNQKQYYTENYPQIVAEKCSIDAVITTIIKGEKQ